MRFIQKVQVGSILIFLSIFSIISFGIDQSSTADLDKKVLQLEDVGKTGNMCEYYSKAKDLIKDISEVKSSTNELGIILTKLFANLIAKEVKIEETQLDDILITEKLVPYLIARESVNDRQANVILLCKYLGKIRKEIIPNYKEQLVYMNIAPPPSVPNAVSGMEPQAIKDPTLRAKYESDIRENQIKNLTNSRQAQLRNVDHRVSKPIIAYIIKSFQSSDISSSLFTECINSANFNDEEKKEIIDKIRSK